MLVGRCVKITLFLAAVAALFFVSQVASSQAPKQPPKTAPGTAPKTPFPPPKAAVPPPKGAFPPPGKQPPPPVAKQAQKKKAKLPDPKNETLETKDGVNIRATWYEGLDKKESVPIIMIHGWDGQRGEYDGLARSFQELGHSTVAIDLRGHGESQTLKLANGETKTIELDSLRRQDLETMAYDVEAAKKFLLEKHNAGECNIELLTVIGADFGSLVALRWAALDWSAPILPAFKQGQDVKALVLLSPLPSHKGLTARDALSHPAVRRMSMMIAAGTQDPKGLAEAKRLYNSLQGSHPKVPDDPEEQLKRQDLFLVEAPTSLAGTKLLGSGLSVPQRIAKFIELRLTNKAADYPWDERKSPLGN